MARTFPTYGLSPIDSYVTQKNLPAGYFEHYASVAEAVAYAVQAKVTQGTTKYVSGLMAAGSFELNLGACADNLGSFGVLELRFKNEGTASILNVQNAGFILFREKSVGVQECPNLFEIMDITEGSDGDTGKLFCACSTAGTANHTI
ncbi:unnamed protein product, partial [marine sediment metagenome]